MYEDRTQNYDPEIHEEYPISLHDTQFSLPHNHVQTIAIGLLQTQLIRLKDSNTVFNFLLWL